MAVWSKERLSTLATGLRLDAEYYQPRYLADAKRLAAHEPRAVSSFAFVTDGIHASPDVVEEGGVRYLSAKCVKDNFFSLGDALQISQSQHESNARTSLRENDVLITTVGTIGNAAVVQSDILPANADRHLGIVRINAGAGIDPYYLATFLNSEYGRFQTLREATGNVQLNLFIEKICDLRIPWLSCASAVAEQTRAAYRERHNSLKAISEAERLLMGSLGLADVNLLPQAVYACRFSDFQRGNRFGAEYYMPAKKRVLDALCGSPSRKLGKHVRSVRDMWDPARTSGDEAVRNFDVTDALEPFLDDSAAPQLAAEIGSAKKRMLTGDVVISRLRSYLKEIAIVQTTDTLPSVGSSEFIVLRPERDGLSAETVMIFLRSPLVQTILRWSQDGSNHPRFTEDDLLSIPVPDALRGVERGIGALVRSGISARRKSIRLLEEAKKTVEKAIASAEIAR